MSTDGSGNVRGTTLFNPHIMDPTNASNGNGLTRRMYEKTTSIDPTKLFATDYLADTGSASSSFSQAYFAHFPSKGFQVLFFDGHTKFVKAIDAFNFVYTGQLQPSSEDTTSYKQYNQMYQWLETEE
jgi:prepilin-type processing-associated H-X9-DG protein